MHIFTLSIAITLLFLGCTTKNFTRTQSAYIVFKTPNLKFADAGFIKSSNKSVTLELYLASNPVVALEISPDTICQGTFWCMDSFEFNTKYLHKSYPKDSLYRIVTGLSLPKALQTSNIRYNTDNQTIRFRDTKNSILITIRKLQ